MLLQIKLSKISQIVAPLTVLFVLAVCGAYHLGVSRGIAIAYREQGKPILWADIHHAQAADERAVRMIEWFQYLPDEVKAGFLAALSLLQN